MPLCIEEELLISVLQETNFTKSKHDIFLHKNQMLTFSKENKASIILYNLDTSFTHTKRSSHVLNGKMEFPVY